MQPIPPETTELETAFDRLVAQLIKETGFHSRMDLAAAHPAYRQIIGMGENALPLIFRRIENDKGPHWFAALEAITNANPVPPQSRGKIRETEELWLEWGRQQGYRW